MALDDGLDLRKLDPGVLAHDLARQVGRQHRLAARAMRAALLDPLSRIYGISFKVLAMALSELLLAGDPTRER
jgi:hypothetical protein